jgi:transcription-repair coupling factor (superfamily II helicase)
MAARVTNSELKRLSDELKRGARVISIGGLTSVSAKAFVLAELQRETGKKFAVVSDSNSSIDTWECDLEFWAQAAVVALPSFDTDIYSGVSPHAETQERRALALWKLTQGDPDFLVMSARALIARTASPDLTRELGAVLKRDEDFPLDELISRLVSVGYIREDPVNGVGQFSIRGGIVDIWPPDSTNPARVEFFGDTVDSIREFDPETQLSTGQLKEISIAPMREFAASAADFRDWAFFAREHWPGEHLARNLSSLSRAHTAFLII